MRKARVYKKYRLSDPVYGRTDLSRFINYLMLDGKKTVAEKILYRTFDLIKDITKQDPVAVWSKAVENISPQVELVSRRVGGANYQIPREVRPERRQFLSMKWIIDAARTKKGKAMAEKLAEEIIAASNNEGDAVRKRENTHKMAEANKAFAHFARFAGKKKK